MLFLSLLRGKAECVELGGGLRCVARGSRAIQASRVGRCLYLLSVHSCFGLWERERSWNSSCPPLCIPQPWVSCSNKPGNTMAHQHTHRAHLLVTEHVYTLMMNYIFIYSYCLIWQKCCPSVRPWISLPASLSRWEAKWWKPLVTQVWGTCGPPRTQADQMLPLWNMMRGCEFKGSAISVLQLTLSDMLLLWGIKA